MIDKFVYINHLNEEVRFGEGCVFVNISDIRNYGWETLTSNNRITGFKQSVSEFTIPVVICAESASKCAEVKNEMVDVFEKDIHTMKHGRIIIGDYYLQCYVRASEKNAYLTKKNLTTLTLTVTTDKPLWIRETKYTFRKQNAVSPYSEGSNSTFLDYPWDFPFDYSEMPQNPSVLNSGYSGTPFKLIVYGEVENPSVLIDEHRYQVNALVQSDEYLVIDSNTKTINLIQSDGTSINTFDKRDRDSYIFEPVPVGESAVSWNGPFGFDLILYEERVEPKWT